MDDSISTTVGSGGLGISLVNSTAQPKLSELERFAQILIDQKEYIASLRNRLDVVSARQDNQLKESAPVDPHLSSLVDMVSRHNSELKQIISELVI